MSRIGITQDEVFAACEQIKKHCATVTIARVRQYLGDTGSYTTVSKYIKLWQNDNTPKARKTAQYILGYNAAVNDMRQRLKGMHK